METTKIGYYVTSGNGRGKFYFYETEEEAWNDVNKKHPKWAIYYGQLRYEGTLPIFTPYKTIKRWC